MARRSYRKRKRNTLSRFILKIILCAMTCLALVLGATIFFKVETIQVEGNSHYSPEEIISATNIQLGANLFSINQSDISKNITYVLPYIQSVDIKLHLPTGIKLVVQEQIGMVQLVTEEGTWYMGVQGKLLELMPEEAPTMAELPEPPMEELEEAFLEGAEGEVEEAWSEELSVESSETPDYSLEHLSNEDSSPVEEQGGFLFWNDNQSYDLDFNPEEESVIVVTGITPLQPVAGELIQVSEEEQKQLQALLNLFQELEVQQMFQQVERINVHEFQYFEFSFNQRFVVKIPFTGDYNYKLRALMAAISDIESYETGIMDLTQEQYVVLFTPD